ncbi:Methyltransferase type 11 [Stanieria cyanosphaera PCC 7437]|uniref:Methyltransferase type 11 n=1 Tax=Stanieria cyanosphaera (strain ATCC 29371 / PCC 7437) TaxID=111780 RepID=K9XRR9_STAC7|nr:class I SAM-dependent methyltransferase [Stanieria cyanosphaera]AFZ34377.1 Methyltransferase type 11 [Stanieria cyanosphaera PCC 7437]
MKQVTYAKQTINNPNPIARFAHQSRVKKSINYTSHNLPDNGSILDFGAGQGYFLNMLAKEKPYANLYGYEPYMNLQHSEFIQVKNLDNLQSSSLDVITAFEVCEHLYDYELHEFLQQTKRLLKPEGTVIISVPIMYGFALIPKELNSMFLWKRKPNYTTVEFWNALWGKQILRPNSLKHNHKGFDFRWLENILKQYFIITKKSFSPYKYLPWYINSQCFFECSKKK